jgi:hypothetical protein
MNSVCGWTLVALVAASAASVSGATRIPLGDSSAAASSTYAGREPKYAVNGAGLNGNQHSNIADKAAWMSATQASTVSGQWFRVDLGRVIPLDHFKLWNFNFWLSTDSPTYRSIREAEVYLSCRDTTPGTDFSDASQWTRVIDRVTFAKAPGDNTYAGEPEVSLQGLQGRWLALRVLSHFSETDLRVGISEVQVFQEESPVTLSVPNNVCAFETGATAARMSWTAPTNAVGVTGYRVFRDGMAIGNSATTNFSDAGPLDGYRSYAYAVSAYDAAGHNSVCSDATLFAYRRFPFTIPWDDAETNSVADMSGLSAGPGDVWVTATNGHLEAGGAPIRFLGVNMVFAAAFPDHASAGLLAARLAKLGVNSVRFHHMDNKVSPGGIFTNVSSSSPAYLRTLDPGQMDRLDYFIARLKDRGIYANLNLHVSRNYPGFPTNGVPSYFKGLDNFMPDMIALQKEYAFDLLTHVNPYTGNAYVDEPALAFIEVNNENGLISTWLNGTFGPSLHTNYVHELTAQWNAWLSARYPDTVALSNAWAPAPGQPYGTELLANGTFSAGALAAWAAQAEAPAAVSTQLVAAAAPDGGYALRLDVTSTGAVRLVQGGLVVTSKRPYTVSFWAKADAPRAASVGFAQNQPPGLPLVAASVALAAEWQKHTLVLEPDGSETNSRFAVEGLGVQTGAVWFAGLSAQTGNALLGSASSRAEWISSTELLVNGNLASGLVSPWSFQVVAPAAASRVIVTNGAPDGSNALEINVATTDATTWHVQYYQSNLHVTNGQPYTLTFWAKTEFPRTAALNLMQQGGAYLTLASASVALSSNWTYHTVVMTPSATEPYARVSVSGLAAQTGRVWFAAHSLRVGSQSVGLPGGEALGAVSRVATKADYALRTRGVQRDWMRFLWDTERAYWTGMREYIRNTLGAKSLLIGTQTSYSPSLLQAEFDVVDSHGYWQHPSFPNKPWDANDYTVKNQPMTGDAAGGNIPGRAQTRVSGKPFVCTEFNHPAPLTYTAEALPLNAAYAALQQWDGLFIFQYHDNTNWSQGHFSSFFSSAREPAKLTTYPFAAAALRRSDVSAAVGEAHVTVPVAVALARIAQTDVALGTTDFGVDSRLALCRRLTISTGEIASVCAPWRDTNASALVSDTGELSWGASQKVVTVRSPRLKALIGDADGQAFDLGHGVVVTPGATMQRSGWCALTLLVREGPGFQSPGSRILLTATGYTDNHRQLWSPGKGPTNLTSMVASTNWGSVPTLLEGIPATVVLGLPAPMVSVWALDERGRRKACVPVADAGGQATFSISRDYRTAWYEVDTRAGQTTPVDLWRADHFTAAELADPAVSGDDADPDGDGLNNLFEYAIGTDPFGAGVDGRFTADLAPDNGADYLTITALKNPAATDVRFSAEVSADLAAWTNDVSILLNDLSTFSARDNTPVSAAPRRFLRTRVNLQ